MLHHEHDASDVDDEDDDDVFNIMVTLSPGGATTTWTSMCVCVSFLPLRSRSFPCSSWVRLLDGTVVNREGDRIVCEAKIFFS